MRKVRVILPSFDLNNSTSVANVLCNLESNDSQVEMAINELIDYVYIIESKLQQLQYQLDVLQDTFDKGKDVLIIMEELSKDVN
jgi:hypothetical protein